MTPIRKTTSKKQKMLHDELSFYMYTVIFFLLTWQEISIFVSVSSDFVKVLHFVQSERAKYHTRIQLSLPLALKIDSFTQTDRDRQTHIHTLRCRHTLLIFCLQNTAEPSLFFLVSFYRHKFSLLLR